MSKIKQEKKPCALCQIAAVSARVDQAMDMTRIMIEGGLVGGLAASELFVRVSEAQFWKEMVERLASESPAKHRKSCRLV